MNPESLDSVLTAIVSTVLLNVYVAPVFWTTMAIVLTPAAPAILWILCLSAASISLLKVWQSPTLSSIQATAITSWTSEIVVISGGSQGVGAHVVDILARHKRAKKVVILDLKPPQEQAESPNIVYYKCNVSDKTAVRQTAARIIAEVGMPTVLINNAGVVSGKLFVDLDESDIERTIGVNLMAHFYLTKAFLPGFLAANRGHILSVASVMGLVGAARVTDYSASKFGVVGFCDSLRQELHGTNVRISCIYPGLIMSGMFNGVTHKNPWMTPPLSVANVANKIVSVLESGKSSDVKMPLYTNGSPLLRMLPIEIADLIRKLTGANDDMNGFIPPK